MLLKMKNKPIWYKIWAISTLVGAVYYAIKHFFFESTSFDLFVFLIVIFSLLIDLFLFPDSKKALSQ